jgi:uncharacterized OB-fold protein
MSDMTAEGRRISLVDYLALGDDPHLEAWECTKCSARYFDRRNACASCEADTFSRVRIANEGTLRAFTIIYMAAPGVAVPFVSGVIDCDGTRVRGNVVNVEATPEHVSTGMKLRLTVFPIGTDDEGVEGIGFGYEPVG